MPKELTDKECQFLLQLLAKLNVNPLSSEAADTVAIVQTIARKLVATTDGTEEKENG